MSAALIKHVYQQGADLIALYRSPFSSRHLKQTLAFTETLLDLLKSHPDLTVAQPSLYKKHVPASVNLLLNAAICTALIAQRNRLNESTAQQLTCAVASNVCLDAQAYQDYFTQDTKVKSLVASSRLELALQKTRQEIWLSGIASLPKKGQKLPQLSPLKLVENDNQTICRAGLLLGVLSTPRAGSATRPFAECIRLLCRQLPATKWHLLAPLLEYPGLISPGSIAITVDGEASIVLGNGEIVSHVSKLKRDSDDAVVLPLAQRDINRLRTLSINGFSKFDGWWGDTWNAHLEDVSIVPLLAPTFRIDSPPPTLMEIQAKVNDPDLDINDLSELIAKESLLKGYLLDMAQKHSRKKIATSNIKQGVMMHGFYGSAALLMQYALLHRINQHQFPLQHDLLQFTQIASHIAGQISQVDSRFVIEPVSTMVTFALSGLFTHPRMKSLSSWEPSKSRWFDINSLVLSLDGAALTRYASRMVDSWRQPSWFNRAINQHHAIPSTTDKDIYHSLSAILGVSLIGARLVYFDTSIKCSETGAYLSQGLGLLGLSNDQFSAIRDDAVTVLNPRRQYPAITQ